MRRGASSSDGDDRRNKPSSSAHLRRVATLSQLVQPPGFLFGKAVDTGGSRSRPFFRNLLILMVGGLKNVRVAVDSLHAACRAHQGETLGQYQITEVPRVVSFAGHLDVGPPGVDARAVVRSWTSFPELPAVHPVIADRSGSPEIQGTVEEKEGEASGSFLKVESQISAHRWVLGASFGPDCEISTG